MTLPYERTRAILSTEQFLKDLAYTATYKRVPTAVKQQAISLLHHYPHKNDLKMTHTGWGSKLHEFMFECPIGDPDETFL